MEKQEFYERAQRLRNQHRDMAFENALISFIVYTVFKNNEELPEKIEFKYDITYKERDEYREKVEKVIDELGLVCEYAACALKQVLIIGPKFK